MKKPFLIKIGRYVIVPRNSIFGVFLITLFTPPVKHWVGGGVVFLMLLFFFLLTSLTSVDIFFITFIFSTFFWNIDGRISIGFALLCLIGIMALTILSGYAGVESAKSWSETVAVWTYYFLVIGVLKQMWEHFREPKDDMEEIGEKSGNAGNKHPSPTPPHPHHHHPPPLRKERRYHSPSPRPQHQAHACRKARPP
jgi:hypothetical protein